MGGPCISSHFPLVGEFTISSLKALNLWPSDRAQLIPASAHQLLSQSGGGSNIIEPLQTLLLMAAQMQCFFLLTFYAAAHGDSKNHVGDLYSPTRISAKKTIGSDCNRLEKV